VPTSMPPREFTVLRRISSCSLPYVIHLRSIRSRDELGRVLGFLVIPFVMMILVIPASATDTILFYPSSVAVEQGGNANITILLDEAPSGLAEFQFDVLLSNPPVAHITGVAFPSWVSIGNVSELPSASVRMSGVDLNHQIEPGDIGIVLGTITIEGGVSGTSAISIKNSHIVEEGGDLINPSIREGTISTGYGGTPITWTPATTVPSIQSTLVATLATPLPGGMNVSENETADSGLGMGTGSLSENATPPTLLVTEATTAAVNPETSLTVEPTLSLVLSEMETTPAVTPVIPTSTTGQAEIPWYALVIGIILACISVYILYLAITKKI
jgi:hypothetical protein